MSKFTNGCLLSVIVGGAVIHAVTHRNNPTNPPVCNKTPRKIVPLTGEPCRRCLYQHRLAYWKRRGNDEFMARRLACYEADCQTGMWHNPGFPECPLKGAWLHELHRKVA